MTSAAKALPSQLQEGMPAPAFDLPADDGSQLSLAALKGKKAVLYFYPKDDTPGCTLEGKDFSALSEQFALADTMVVGVSKDSVASHCKFRDKYSLTIRLASDESGQMAEDYSVWVEKNMYGKKYMGIERTTFLLDEEGVIRKIWRKVKVENHAQEVLAATQNL